MQNLGEEIKIREKANQINIEPYEFICARFDGKCFSKFTKGFKKPFDINFYTAMIRTLNDTMIFFRPTIGYVQSDEITLVFAPLCSKDEYFKMNKKERPARDFNGRSDKILSLISAYISVKFNMNLSNVIDEYYNNYSDEFKELIRRGDQIFDGRILIYSEDEDRELVKYFRWRMSDCYRNCVSGYSRRFFSQKEIDGKNTNEKIEMMKEKGFDFNLIVDEAWKNGTFMKKELLEREGIDVKTGEKISFMRTEITEKVLTKEGLEMEGLFRKKYW